MLEQIYFLIILSIEAAIEYLQFVMGWGDRAGGITTVDIC